jgi:hypothetical protein
VPYKFYFFIVSSYQVSRKLGIEEQNHPALLLSGNKQGLQEIENDIKSRGAATF